MGGAPARDDAHLLDGIARGLDAGRIGLGEARRRIDTAGAPAADSEDDAPARERPARRGRGARGPAAPEPAPPVPPPVAPKTRDWVEFRLVDDASGAPVAGIAFEIELPGGEVVTRTTDGNGLIRIEGIAPGSCAVRRIAAGDGPDVTRVA